MAMTRVSRAIPRKNRRLQGGAVLYVALIMLILLALIGVVGMQVSAMQERMAANYRSVNRAFQNAEGVVRQTECAIESIVNRTPAGSCTIIVAQNIRRICDEDFDPGAWGDLQNLAASPAVNVRQIDSCVQGEAPLDMGVGPVSENTFPIYQITSYAVDDAANATSSSVIDTIFKL